MLRRDLPLQVPPQPKSALSAGERSLEKLVEDKLKALVVTVMGMMGTVGERISALERRFPPASPQEGKDHIGARQYTSDLSTRKGEWGSAWFPMGPKGRERKETSPGP